ncbi:MAG: helix-turn-helix domain-containing protein [Ruminococcus flavefaciens]|nr:helix-turn-helix domain-containing protein [Ruminococcus flavefaciens]MCM1061670.1 helix-turn-helix domain-containing protein [Eubacterium sp.]
MKGLIDVRKTGYHIKTLCERKNITPALLQDVLKLKSPQAVYKWFRGETLPSAEHLFILAELLDQPVEELIVLRNRAITEKRIAGLIRWAGGKAKYSPLLREAFCDVLADLIIRS